MRSQLLRRGGSGKIARNKNARLAELMPQNPFLLEMPALFICLCRSLTYIHTCRLLDAKKYLDSRCMYAEPAGSEITERGVGRRGLPINKAAGTSVCVSVAQPSTTKCPSRPLTIVLLAYWEGEKGEAQARFLGPWGPYHSAQSENRVQLLLA